MDSDILDCLVVGAGPAGLTAGLYLARYGRSFLLADAGDPRAAWIPVSHNIPFFPEGVSGPDILARGRGSLAPYGTKVMAAEVSEMRLRPGGGFEASLRLPDGARRQVAARHALLATGADDHDPPLPELRHAVRRGLIRYCPICDGYEARGKRVAVVGHRDRALREAAFIAGTYGVEVAVFAFPGPSEEAPDGRDAVDHDLGPDSDASSPGVSFVREPVASLGLSDDGLAVVTTRDGAEHRFDTIYSAMGLSPRSGLAAALGAERNEDGALVIDHHGRTSVGGLYAAGGVARGLDQVVIAMGQAAAAATDIHNQLRGAAPDGARISA